jgi:hypothetical protein
MNDSERSWRHSECILNEQWIKQWLTTSCKTYSFPHITIHLSTVQSLTNTHTQTHSSVSWSKKRGDQHLRGLIHISLRLHQYSKGLHLSFLSGNERRSSTALHPIIVHMSLMCTHFVTKLRNSSHQTVRWKNHKIRLSEWWLRICRILTVHSKRTVRGRRNTSDSKA